MPVTAWGDRVKSWINGNIAMWLAAPPGMSYALPERYSPQMIEFKARTKRK
jgi:hypothetical protein